MPPPAPKADLATMADLARARSADRVRGRLMQAALKTLLDEVRGARAAFPPLAALEDALGRRGVSAVDEVPLHWLVKMTQQLGSLPLRDEDLELQDLLSCLCKAVARAQRAAPGDDGRASAFEPTEPMEVRELGHSAFIQEFEALQAEVEPVLEGAARAPR